MAVILCIKAYQLANLPAHTSRLELYRRENSSAFKIQSGIHRSEDARSHSEPTPTAFKMRVAKSIDWECEVSKSRNLFNGSLILRLPPQSDIRTSAAKAS